MKKIQFMGIVGALIGIGISIMMLSIGPTLIGTGVGVLAGGMLGYLDGEFQDPKQTFSYINRQRGR